MEAKLQELTKKIYQEGVEKAENEAKALLEEASQKADNIIAEAKKKADSIVTEARRDADNLNTKVLSELKMSGNQAMTSLKQQVTQLLASNALSSDIKNATGDKEFIKSVISDLLSKWGNDSKSLDLELILPEQKQKELLDYFKSKAKDLLDKGMELKFESRMDGGFKIGPKDHSYVLSFTDRDFEQFFQSFLKAKTKEILFS